MKLHKINCVVIAFACLSPSAVIATDEKGTSEPVVSKESATKDKNALSLTGTWKLKIDSPQGKTDEKILFFRQQGQNLSIFDPEESLQTKGIVNKDRLLFTVPIDEINEKPKDLQFHGIFSEKIAGGILKNDKSSWRMERLYGTWTCSGHTKEPEKGNFHSPSTTEQMVALTKKWGCEFGFKRKQ